MSTTATPGTDYLAGIDSKTTRAELIQRLTSATEELRGETVAKAARLQKMEEDIRKRWAGMSTEPLLRVIVQGTEGELTESLEFMTDLEDVLPATLQRLLAGCRTLLESNGNDST